MASLVEPYQVSPLIKISRYSLLVAGIFYGIAKHKAYSIKQRKIRENYLSNIYPKVKAEEEEKKKKRKFDEEQMLEFILHESFK